jgi:rhodanese-related sulfurtransferase
MKSLLPKDKRGLLLVCMAGQTSLRVAEILALKGTAAVSITGGIMNVAESGDKSPSDLVQIARE